MPRPLRICEPQLTYHCYSRCIELRNMLSPDFVKEMAVESIEMALEKYSFELIHVEFVENHFHIVIKTLTKDHSISKIMQFIKARITEKYNRMHGRTGTLWNERFKCKIIEHSQDPQYYLLWLLWYIAYNPVRKRVIRDPRESAYGTIKVYLEEEFQPRLKITLHQYFIDLGNSFKERVNKFLEYEDLYRRYLASL